MATYTQTNGSEDVEYFMDVAISPATVKDGSLRKRFDPIVYPKVGTTAVNARGLATVVVTASSLTPVHATSITLTATVTPVTHKPVEGVVTFFDGVTSLGTATPNATTGVATLTVAGGVTAGAHTITAQFVATVVAGVNPKTATSAAITVTAS